MKIKKKNTLIDLIVITTPSRVISNAEITDNRRRKCTKSSYFMVYDAEINAMLKESKRLLESNLISICNSNEKNNESIVVQPSELNVTYWFKELKSSDFYIYHWYELAKEEYEKSKIRECLAEVYAIEPSYLDD